VCVNNLPSVALSSQILKPQPADRKSTALTTWLLSHVTRGYIKNKNVVYRLASLLNGKNFAFNSAANIAKQPHMFDSAMDI